MNSTTQVLGLSGLHGPENPVKVEPGSAAAVNVSVAPGSKFAVQVAGAPQSIPSGEDVTVPDPVPVFETVNTGRVRLASMNSPI